MAPTIHCLRHAQGYHNLTIENHVLRDPDLTDLGREQCNTVSDTFPYMTSVDLIVASPLRRTLYTALLSFAPVIKAKGLKIIALPELQETSDLPCDTGSDVDKLKEEFGSQVDFSRVRDGWYDKSVGAMGEPTAGKIVARARTVKKWLAARPEQNIAVVTHGGYLHYFTDDWGGIANLTAGSGWANCEFRSYNFILEHAETDVLIIETPESRARRRGNEKPLSDAEQANLRATTIATWAKMGYIKATPADGLTEQQEKKMIQDVFGNDASAVL